MEPFGDGLLDMRLVENTTAFCNANRDRGKRPDPYTLDDFAPYMAEPVKLVDLGPEENARLIRAQLEAMRTA